MNMESSFRQHIAQHFPFLLEGNFFIAVSGGLDSMVLVHLFKAMEVPFGILHCNFGLRGKESDRETAFVEEYAEKNNIRCRVAYFDTKKYASTHKLSTQVAARNLRYNWFYEQMEAQQAAYVLTAHHADDNLETFLINLSRGTGLDGLLGIPAQNDKIVRPLLPFSREDIENYAKANQLQWREDASNASDDYLRNKIRHHLTPVLKELNPDFLQAFQKTQKYLLETASMANDAASIVFSEVGKQTINGDYHFDLQQLNKLPNRNSYLYHWLNGFGFTAWEDIYKLPEAQSGKQVFSPTHLLLKDRNQLILSLKKETSVGSYQIEKNTGHVNIPLKFTFCNVTDISQPDSNCIFVDEDLLNFPLTLRKWDEGDYFYPFGMKGKKKLGKYFKDEKMSLPEKQEAWLLCSDNQVLWIVGKRQDDRFRVTPNTTKILQICTLT